MTREDLYHMESVRSERISKDSLFMGFVDLLSQRSTCKRLSVGCCVTDSDGTRVMALGYNGNYRHGPNTCDSDEPGACGCIHAEMNCLLKLDYGFPGEKIMYITDSPCLMCAKAIINAGVSKIVYRRQYRNPKGLELLVNNGIAAVRFQERPI